MFQRNTDKDWEHFGKLDPYFGVLSSDEFKLKNLNEESMRQFFSSGKQLVDYIMNMIHTKLDADFKPARGLDFGCGTARLTIPLASYCESTIGTDVSQEMLNKARHHAQEAGIDNINFVLNDDQLSGLDGKFDFILSFIVLQHIPVARGEKIFEELSARLTPGGIACIHVPFMREMSPLRQLGYKIRTLIPPVHMLLNLISRRPFNYPMMQYNIYDFNHLFQILQAMNCKNVYLDLIEEADSSGRSIYRSARIYFQKQ